MPLTRREFEHNMWLLSEQQIRVTRESSKAIKGLREARHSPNKRINLHTINESARAMANTIVSMMKRQERK